MSRRLATSALMSFAVSLGGGSSPELSLEPASLPVGLGDPLADSWRGFGFAVDDGAVAIELLIELEGCWDLSVFVQVDPAVSLERASKRDVALFGTRDAAERRYRERYLPGQGLYMSQVFPDQRADVLIDNTDLTSPELLRIPPA